MNLYIFPRLLFKSHVFAFIFLLYATIEKRCFYQKIKVYCSDGTKEKVTEKLFYYTSALYNYYLYCLYSNIEGIEYLSIRYFNSTQLYDIFIFNML